MVERQLEVDLQSEFLQEAYNSFKELAQKYGQPPKEGMSMPTNGRVFSVDIPNGNNAHKHPDNVAGRYFGPDTGRIEILYRHEDTATQVNLIRNSHGKVTIDNYYLYALVHTKTGYTLHTHRGENIEPDINSLNELLKKAKEILETPKKEQSSVRPIQRSEDETELRRGLALDMGKLHSQRLKNEKAKRGKKR